MTLNVFYIFIPSSGALIQNAVSAFPWYEWGKITKNLNQGGRHFLETTVEPDIDLHKTGKVRIP
jgi:hypothetical protein